MLAENERSRPTTIYPGGAARERAPRNGMSGQYVVIGLGQLGSAMMGTLLSLGHEVLGIDSDRDVVQELSGEFPDAHLFAADATEESHLRGLNIKHFDAAAVVIGENMEANILATANLKEI